MHTPDWLSHLRKNPKMVGLISILLVVSALIGFLIGRFPLFFLSLPERIIEIGKGLLDFILDILNYPQTPTLQIKQGNRLFSFNQDDKGFGDFLFLVAGIAIAWGTWRANSKSADAATIALEEFRPKLIIADPGDDDFEITNVGDFDAYKIKLFYKRTSDTSFVRHALSESFLSHNEARPIVINLASGSSPMACVLSYRNIATDRTYCYAVIIYSQKVFTIGSKLPELDIPELMQVHVYEELMKLTSLKNQILGGYKSDKIDADVAKLLE